MNYALRQLLWLVGASLPLGGQGNLWTWSVVGERTLEHILREALFLPLPLSGCSCHDVLLSPQAQKQEPDDHGLNPLNP